METFHFPVGRDVWSVPCDPARVVALTRAGPLPSPLADPRSAVTAALDRPIRYEPLRRTLTPDDRVAVLLDERLPHLIEMLSAVLEHVTSAGVPPESVTVLTPPASRQNWLDDLPDEFQDIHVERHDPHDAKRLGYVATTQGGRRVYLNRTLADSDASVVLSARSFDPLHGYGGCEATLYPQYADAETWKHYAEQYSTDAPREKTRPSRQDAVEVAWLLGEPFIVQVIESSGDGVARVIAGRTDSSSDGQMIMDAYWRATVAEQADVAIATMTGDPARHDFLDIARAAACAARVVRPDGRVVVLTQAAPHLGDGAKVLQRSGGVKGALRRMVTNPPSDYEAAFLWAFAAGRTRLSIASQLPDEDVEAMSATPIGNAGQVQRVIGDGTCVFIPDAHRMMVTVAGS